MGTVVDASQPATVDVAVDLRRRERAVAEELLDHPEVGAALEQVGGEGVPETMGVGDEAAQRARIEPAAAGGDEERVLRAGCELGAPVAEVEAEPVCGLLTERDDPLFSALAADVDRLRAEVDVREVEVDRLLAPQAGRVDELGERAVAELERLGAVEASEQLVELRRFRRLRQPARAARRQRNLRDAVGA